ncbi:MAG: ATP-dependent Clp protease ATP-binding subunit [Spirochaetes bacterium]|nr:ATP-dependent Clp protease ATP-binding subunit [Spirochaetota bacterium]
MKGRYERYSGKSIEIFLAMQDIALRDGRAVTDASDLSRALLFSAVPELLAIAHENGCDLDRDRIKRLFDETGSKEPGHLPPVMKLAPDFRGILDEAEKLAGDGKVEPGHIIRAAWPVVRQEVSACFKPSDDPLSGPERTEITLPEPEETPERNKALRVLEQFGRELTSRDRSFAVFGRDEEIDNLVSILMKYFKPNPLIIGEPGVGKTALVEGLAERVKAGNVPPALKGARIFEVRVGDLSAGTNVHGAFEERLRDLVRAVESNPDIIVFLDEIHQIAQAYGNEPTADILKPALSKGRFRCIGATTTSDYHRFLERDDALLRRFQTVLVKEPDRATVRVIMNGLKPRLETHYGIEIPDETVERAITVSEQYLPMRFFPDKAIDVLDRACSKAGFKLERRVNERHLRDAVTDIANIRFDPQSDAPGESVDLTGLAKLEAKIATDIIGQTPAIASVVNVLRICKKHLDLRPERPDGAFLFTGPTGVGKTALAESLARHLTGRDDALFRIDMSEFSESHSVARLIGAPPGYVGYGDMALLSQAVEKHAGGVVLLDEFEKAHPQVHRLFLQILDAGRIMDAYGKTLSFSNMTIIATCNVGDDNRTPIGFSGSGPSERPAVPLARLKQVFPPELLNRFDEIVPFRALTRDDCTLILREVIVRKANAAIEAEYGFSMEYDASALDLIVDKGYSADFGARNLQRAFQDLVTSPLAVAIDSFRGSGTVSVRAEGGELRFKPVSTALNDKPASRTAGRTAGSL